MKSIANSLKESLSKNKCSIRYVATEKLQFLGNLNKYEVGSQLCGSVITRHNFSSKSGKGVIEFEKNITEIKSSTFDRLDQLISISIPDTVTSIEEAAIRFCKRLNKVDIPNSIVTIKSYAFEQCDKLKYVEIPASICSISGNIFRGIRDVRKLHTLVIYKPTVPTVANNFADGIYFCGVKNILVPKSSVDAYKEAWPLMADIIKSI